MRYGKDYANLGQRLRPLSVTSLSYSALTAFLACDVDSRISSV